MILAGLLNRTLLVPMEPREVAGGYDLRIVYDVVHARHCYGYAIMTTREYFRKFRRRPVIDEILCWHGPHGACPEEDKDLTLNCPLSIDSNKLWSNKTSEGSPPNTRMLTILYSKFLHQKVVLQETARRGVACLPMVASLDNVLMVYQGSTADVLVVGDLVNIDIATKGRDNLVLRDRAGTRLVSPAWREPPFVRTPYCPSNLTVQPDGSLLKAARGYIEEQFGSKKFAAVHWRRGDFKAFCFWHGPNQACFFPPKQVAHCLAESLKEIGITNIHLSTNGKRQEVFWSEL